MLTKMDVRAQLNEYLQKLLHQNPIIRIRSVYHRSEQTYSVVLQIWNQSWICKYADSIYEGRVRVMRKALNELMALQSENAVRERLGLKSVYRIDELTKIRTAMRELKKKLKESDKRFLIPLLAKMYPIVEKLEDEMQDVACERNGCF